MNAVDHILAKADGASQDRQQLGPSQLPQKPDERVADLGEVCRNLPRGLWRRSDGHAAQDEGRNGKVGRDEGRNVECVQVEADVEELVAEAEEEERSLERQSIREPLLVRSCGRSTHAIVVVIPQNATDIAGDGLVTR